MNFRQFFLFTSLIFLCIFSYAQKPSLTIVNPSSDNAKVNISKQFITGRTTPDCSVTINGTPVKVYKTGVFVYTVNLTEGINSFDVIAFKSDKANKKTVEIEYQIPKPIKETDTTIIEKITVEPAGDIALLPGEYLLVKVKAKPNCKVVMNDKYTLTELPKSQTKGIAGYYQINYKIKESDNFLLTKLKFDLLKNGKIKDTKIDKNTYTIFNDEEPLIGKTNMQYTPIYSGLGEDRLGGTKAGFLDSAVMVQIIGRINNVFKVKMNRSLTVYIPKDNIDLLPTGNAIPKSLTNNITTSGDSIYDYLKISLNNKLPYLSNQNVQPNQILIDIFGATNNSNWVMQFPETLKEIEDVDITQLQDEQIRVTIDLKNKQLWGYKTYYEGNTLVIQVRRQKEDLSLRNLVIGIDAGHGGSNEGAKGIAGKYEKEFTLLIAKELRNMLEAKGAKIIMTREVEESYENQERLKMFRRKMPDFVISIHLNSADDPIRVKGVSTYYKYNTFKNLSSSIYKRVTQTGLNGWGNIGNFNFFLNSATEFPSALVECLFISNPEDEEKLYDPSFRTLFNQKIVVGIEDWLQQCAINK